MKIGLIDVDGHNFPNLALMRISAYYKACGDEVEWWKGDLFHYDIVYMAKVFSAAYSRGMEEPMNADRIIKGGTGYCITLENGKEVFHKDLNINLPAEIEGMSPDYTIYPEYNYAVSMTSRGCPRGCPFCVVGKKEGLRSVKVADVSAFYKGQKHIEVLDPNITACPDKHDLFEQYIETGATITFNQGLDIRLITEKDISYLNEMRLKTIHFAWDKPNEDLTEQFRMFYDLSNIKNHRRLMVYCLTNYNSTVEQDLHRIYTLRDLGYSPFVMIYNKPSAPRIIKQMQRWCNNSYIFRAVPNFRDYIG